MCQACLVRQATERAARLEDLLRRAVAKLVQEMSLEAAILHVPSADGELQDIIREASALGIHLE